MKKSELLALMREGQSRISEGLPVNIYVMECVDVMFEVAAAVLADEGEQPPDQAND